MSERPGWIGNTPGVDVMTRDEAKTYVQQWNGQDLANIDVNSPGWTKFAAFASDPENQAMVASLGMLDKDLIQLVKATTSQNINIANQFTKTPQSIWGAQPITLLKIFKMQVIKF